MCQAKEHGYSLLSICDVSSKRHDIVRSDSVLQHSLAKQKIDDVPDDQYALRQKKRVRQEHAYMMLDLQSADAPADITKATLLRAHTTGTRGTFAIYDTVMMMLCTVDVERFCSVFSTSVCPQYTVSLRPARSYGNWFRVLEA